MKKHAYAGVANLRAENTAAIVEQPKAEPNPAKPTSTQSQRDALLDALAEKVLRREPLPSRITVAGEEVDTSTFLLGSRYDRRAASGMLARLAPECFVGNALASECAAQIGFALEAQAAKAEQHSRSK
jgi:hypothetical protein